ncbi:gliding motility-associated peptidyl-prolyl isomerase GldI [Polaribacter sp. MSW13]|uniref:Peptidyl-prolyl cis-trans isomerase n=1 Tax=Polaribacter marinus TaxID=2916838 RepID=A0A9X1VKU5_9FLAO|nr:gliding motility-associated peptidyl-prolyl isomerase GldI [Polaribacter marinus]MCI2228002.1 gliding motility-associated peptidyl-prolyl isomerase GldI [Polaribacter marinus]
MKIRFLFFAILCLGCAKEVPRRPIDPKPSTTLLSETISTSKALNKIEENKIIELIKKDSLRIYQQSSYGFWYTYINKIDKDLPTPQTGNEVSFEYEITDLNNTVLYSKEELGIKNYTIDKEDFITAIQKGIKLMKIGETVTFVIPSYSAYGITGDGNKIGMNQSIKSTITLLTIK